MKQLKLTWAHTVDEAGLGQVDICLSLLTSARIKGMCTTVPGFEGGYLYVLNLFRFVYWLLSKLKIN